MRNAVKTIGKVHLLAFALVAPALAQSLRSAPVPAVAGPAYDVSIGYTNLMMAIPGAGHANLNGLNVSGSVRISPRWGVTADSTYARTSTVLSTPHQGYVLGAHSGPVFYPFESRNTRVFVHGLAGFAIVDGAVPISATEYFHGWLGRLSYVAGGGVEHSISESCALRVSGDYLRTEFYNSAGAVTPQNNLQLTVGVVFRLRDRRHRSANQVQ